jgi:transcriptional regulator with XRE-family HTH domain
MTESAYPQTSLLRDLRRLNRWSLRFAAGQVPGGPVDATHLSRVERELAMPSIDLVIRLGLLYGVDPRALLDPFVVARTIEICTEFLSLEGADVDPASDDGQGSD